MDSFRGAVHPSFAVCISFVFFAFAQAAFTSGIIFGWPALQLLLTRVGAFEQYCKPTEMFRPCPAQTMYFNTIYTSAIFANNVSSFFVGAFLDKFGPKWTNFAGFLLFMCGGIPFIFGAEKYYVIGYTLLGFSGPGIYVSIMHLSNLFPGNSSFVLSVFSGTFAVSSLVFKTFELLYKPDSWLDIPHLFIALEVVLAPLALVGLVVWPNLPYNTKIIMEDNVPLVGPQNSYKFKSRLYNTSLKVQLSSMEFWIPTIWISLQALHIHFYVGSINVMFMNTMSYITTFNWIWLGGAIAIPFFGVMVDKRGTTFSFFICSILFLLFSICTIIPVMKVQYGSFALVAFTNVGVWSVVYTYFFNVFGVKNYGKILGVSFGVIATVGLLQYPIQFACINYFNYSFTYANIMFGIISLVMFAQPVYLWRVDMKKKKRLLMHKMHEGEGLINSESSSTVSIDDT